MSENIPEILKKSEVAELFDLSRRTIDYQIAAKTIPHFRVGRSVRFRKATLLEWIEKQENESTPKPE